MKEEILNHLVNLNSFSVKMIIGGGSTAVFFGYTFTQIELQAIGVFIGAVVGIGGLVAKLIAEVGRLIIEATARYYERKDRVQVLLKSGEWDGKERRTSGDS